jgi:hypothetical protein
MQPVTAELRRQASSGAPSRRKRVARWLRQHWDCLGVLLLFFCTIPPKLLSPHSLMVVVADQPTDYSWKLDTCFKASRGVWFGRDVTFTYGPLFQWLSSAPARWIGLSMGTVSATGDLLPLWCTFLAIYLTLQLLMPEQPPWRRFLLLMVVSAWAPRDLRVCLGILIFAIFLTGWYGVREGQLKPAMLGFTGAVACVAAFLYSADTGAYAIAAWLVSLAGVMWEDRYQVQPLPKYGSVLPTFMVVGFGLILGTNSVLATTFDFRFWKNSLLMISAHRWLLPHSMLTAGKIYMLGILLVGSMIFLLANFIRPNGTESVIAARSGFRVSAFTFAIILMQRAVVRSDRGHISGGVFAMMLFTGVILFSFRARRWPAMAALAGMTCWLVSFRLALTPESTFDPLSVRERYRQVLNPISQCPPPLMDFDGACYGPVFTANLRASSDYLQQHSTPDDAIVIFPYQTFYGIAARRNVGGGLLLSYLVSGAHLSEIELSSLNRTAPPAGLYIVDSERDSPVDKVSNFTRSPELWLWLFQNYRSEQQLRRDIFGLVRDNSRAAQISLQPLPLQVKAQRYPIKERISVIDLGQQAWPGDGADFLRLRLTVHYDPLWQLRKPEQLQLEIARTDGSLELRPFVIEPNVPSDIWFYPWNDLDLSSYFAADESHWRSGLRPPVTHLRLWVTPLDWFSQRPDWVQIESASAVRAHLSALAPRP